MKDNEILEITYESLAVSTTLSGDTRGIQDNVANINFLGKCQNVMTQLCYNPQGSYSPLTNQLSEKSCVLPRFCDFSSPLLPRCGHLSASRCDSGGLRGPVTRLRKYIQTLRKFALSRPAADIIIHV